MPRLFRRLGRRLGRALVREAWRSVRNTFQYEIPGVAAWVARQVQPPEPPPPERPPRPVKARRHEGTKKPNISEQPTPAPAPAPLPQGGSARQQLIREALRLKAAIDASATLTEYQDLAVRYRRIIAALAALEGGSGPTKVKSHKRNGSKVKSYTRSKS